MRTAPLDVMTGAAGTAWMVTFLFGDAVPLPQALVPFTVITPVPGVVPNVTWMLNVVPPEVMVAPAGMVHV